MVDREGVDPVSAGLVVEDTEARLIKNMALGCTVRYDEWSGCGVNVVCRQGANRTFVELSFLTRTGLEQSHSLTGSQVEQLRAALDAVSRVDPPESAPDGPRLRIIRAEDTRPARAVHDRNP